MKCLNYFTKHNLFLETCRCELNYVHWLMPVNLFLLVVISLFLCLWLMETIPLNVLAIVLVKGHGFECCIFLGLYVIFFQYIFLNFSAPVFPVGVFLF